MSGLIEIDAIDDDDLPSPDSAEIMAEVDAMSKRWRDLVYEFGYVIVRAMHDDFAHVDHGADHARVALNEWRAKRQREWLTTNYLSPRARRSFEAHF